MQDKIGELRLQQEKICELLEKGVYTVEIFTKRNDSLEKEIRNLQISETELLEQCRDEKQMKSRTDEIIPTTQRILDQYGNLKISEKNSLWKMVLEKITMYRPNDKEFDLHIYPKLPMEPIQYSA